MTNKTWEHFWLNEGFTVFNEMKIVGTRFPREIPFLGSFNSFREGTRRAAAAPELAFDAPLAQGGRGRVRARAPLYVPPLRVRPSLIEQYFPNNRS